MSTIIAIYVIIRNQLTEVLHYAPYIVTHDYHMSDHHAPYEGCNHFCRTPHTVYGSSSENFLTR